MEHNKVGEYIESVNISFLAMLEALDRGIAVLVSWLVRASLWSRLKYLINHWMDAMKTVIDMP